jgi:hypothetical protein
VPQMHTADGQLQQLRRQKATLESKKRRTPGRETFEMSDKQMELDLIACPDTMSTSHCDTVTVSVGHLLCLRYW